LEISAGRMVRTCVPATTAKESKILI